MGALLKKDGFEIASFIVQDLTLKCVMQALRNMLSFKHRYPEQQYNESTCYHKLFLKLLSWWAILKKQPKVNNKPAADSANKFTSRHNPELYKWGYCPLTKHSEECMKRAVSIFTNTYIWLGFLCDHGLHLHFPTNIHRAGEDWAIILYTFCENILKMWMNYGVTLYGYAARQELYLNLLDPCPIF